MPADSTYQTLLRMADKDRRALHGMIESDVFDDEIFGFHAQQAVEKILKAWIAFHGIAFPLTHDIGTLLEMLSEKDTRIEEFRHLISLTIYGVLLRYSPLLDEEEKFERHSLIGEIDRLYALASNLSE